MAQEWYYERGGEPHGPVSSAELKSAADIGELQPDSLVWSEGMPDWVSANQVNGLFPGKPADESISSDLETHSPPLESGSAMSDLSAGDDLRIELTKCIQKAVAGFNGIIPYPDIPEEKLQAVKRAYAPLQPGEQPLCLHDATIMGSGAEGVLLSTRGVYWQWPMDVGGLAQNLGEGLAKGFGGGLTKSLSAPLAMNLTLAQKLVETASTPEMGAKRENTQGFLAYEDIESGCVVASFGGKLLCERSIQLSRDARVRFGAIDEPGLKSLAGFIVHAAQLAQIKSAERKIEAGDRAGAIQILRDAVQNDTCMVPDVAPLVEQIIQAAPDLEEGQTLHQEIQTKSADRRAWWFVRGLEAEAVAGPHDLAELMQQFHSGHLFPDDSVKHFSDGSFTLVGQTEPFSKSGAIYFRDTGAYDPEVYREACGLAHETLGDELAIFFNTGGDKVPLVHIGMTDEELVVVQADSEGKLAASKDTFESAACAFDEARENLTLATRDGNFEVPLVAGSGRFALIEKFSQIMFERAKVNFAEKKYFTAEKLALQIADPLVVQEEIDSMTAGMGVVAELIGVYDGGHPDFPDKAIVAIRLDAHGLELSPVMPGAEFYDRVPYGDVQEVLPPARGQLPDELAKDLAKSRRNTGMLKVGLGVAVSTVIPGGGLLVGGLMGKGKQTAPPTNRICIVLVIKGSRYRLFFDAFGGSDSEALNKLAKTFWSNAISVQNKFNKPAAKRITGAGPAITSAEAKTQTKLLREIRDMLKELVSTNHLRDLGQLLEAGTLTQEEFETRKSRLLSTMPPSGGKKDTSVVGCPKCSIKLRANEPGVVQCPKCSTKVRVDESFF